ncbi:MAG: AMP-binding protein [Acidobacteria bacterium]|nr:AMP-binding protein [Acidobacteriota bacterium]
MPETLAKLFRHAISYDKRDAILTKQDLLTGRSGRYEPISSREMYRRVAKLQLALARVGVRKGDRCALLSENRWEWAVSDFAMMTAGIISVPLYPTLGADQLHYMLEHSEARVVLVSTAEQLAKIQEVWPKLPRLEGAAVFDLVSSDDERVVGVQSLIGTEPLTDEETRAFEAGINAVQPEDVASIIYTSGTTGVPKGVVLTHNNLGTNVRDCGFQIETGDLCLSFLPLSHVAERIADYVYFHSGATVAYAESFEAVPQNMQEIRPTVAVAVPRFFEKIHGRVTAAIAAAPTFRRKLIEWALRVGERALPFRSHGQRMPFWLGLQQTIADLLVFKKLRDRLGGRFRMMFSGAAPLSRHLAEFFYIVGIPIYEAYGLTETSPLISINTPDHFRFGTVGRLIRNVEARLAEDDEILVRGPNIMKGYYKGPEATAEVIDADGWFHTGDIGKFDSDGYLSIIDRKKDLLKTSGGKYIAPQPIENLLKTSPYISMAIVFAEGRKFPCALIIPEFEKVKFWAQERRIEFRTLRDLIDNKDVFQLLFSEVEKACEPLARYEKPKKILLLDRELSIEDGEITPSMKVRRRAVEMKFARQIDALYD